MSKIVITGVTGQLGGLVVKHLLDRGVAAQQIKGVARTPEKASELSKLGVEIVHGDYDEGNSLVEAFEGASKLLFVAAPSYDNTLRVRQHATVAEAARNARVGHIIYTSSAFPEKMRLGLENMHLATEYMLRATTLPFTFLRNTFYMETLVNPGLPGIVASGEIVTSVPTGKMNYVTRNDLALAAAIVLNSEGHENRTYELANPAPFSYDQFAAILSEVAGKPIKHRTVTPEKAIELMREAGIPDARSSFVVYGVYKAVEDGQFSYPSEDLINLLGTAYTSPAQAIQQVLQS